MKRMTIRLLALATLVSLANGCAVVDAKSPQGLERPDRTAGLIIFSTGAPETNTSFGTFVNVYKMVGEEPDMKAMAASFSLNSTLVKSHFDDHPGSIRWRFLLPGKYAAIPIIANPYAYYVKPPKAVFEIKSGETLYLGEFWLEGGRIAIRDRFQRDIAVFHQSNPDFPVDSIGNRLLTFVESR